MGYFIKEYGKERACVCENGGGYGRVEIWEDITKIFGDGQKWRKRWKS